MNHLPAAVFNNVANNNACDDLKCNDLVPCKLGSVLADSDMGQHFRLPGPRSLQNRQTFACNKYLVNQFASVENIDSIFLHSAMAVSDMVWHLFPLRFDSKSR